MQDFMVFVCCLLHCWSWVLNLSERNKLMEAKEAESCAKKDVERRCVSTISLLCSQNCFIEKTRVSRAAVLLPRFVALR